MYKTSEIAKILNISKSTVKFYDNKGIINAKRDKNNYRIYNNEDIIKIISYETYRNLGYSLNDSLNLIKHLPLDEYEAKINKKLEELFIYKDLIEKKLEYLQRAKFNLETYNRLQKTEEKVELVKCENMLFFPIQGKNENFELDKIIKNNLTWYSFEYKRSDNSILWGLSIDENHFIDYDEKNFIKHKSTICLHTIVLLKDFSNLQILIDSLYDKYDNLSDITIGCVLNNVNDEEILLEILIPKINF